MTFNRFTIDNEWQKEIRNNILVPFYYENAKDGRFVLVDKGKFSEILQQEMSVDTVLQKENGEAISVEEKIVRWPGYIYDSFVLETWSCTVKDNERKGWMYTARCDILFYCFVQENGMDVIAYSIPFRILQRWFFNGGRFEKYKQTITNQINHTECRIVPIVDVMRAIPQTKYHNLSSYFGFQ